MALAPLPYVAEISVTFADETIHIVAGIDAGDEPDRRAGGDALRSRTRARY
jgi:hypothetical protein